MATYTTPDHVHTHEERIIERDSSGGVWGVIAAIIVVLALLLLASAVIRSRNNLAPTENNTNITVPGDTNLPPDNPNPGTPTNPVAPTY